MKEPSRGRFLTIFRAYRWDNIIDRLAQQAYEATEDGDFLVAADVTRGDIDPGRFTVLKHTKDTEHLGLICHPEGNSLWYNWDYILGIVLDSYPDYQYYVVSESDVAINIKIPPVLDEMDRQGLALVTGHVKPANPDWMWLEGGRESFPDPLQCILCFSVFSKPAAELIHKKRQELSSMFRRGDLDAWPFCEVVVPNAVRDAGLSIGNLSDFADLSHFDFSNKYLIDDDVARRPGSLVHSVVSAEQMVLLNIDHLSFRDFVTNRRSLNAISQLASDGPMSASLLRKVVSRNDFCGLAQLRRPYQIDLSIFGDPNDLCIAKPSATSSTSEWSHRHVLAESDLATSPFFEGEFAFHTELEESPWFIVDLLDLCQIRAVMLMNRRTYSERLGTILVQTSMSSEDWATVARHEDSASTDYIKIDLPDLTIARFIRIVKQDPGVLHLKSIHACGRKLEVGELSSVEGVCSISSIYQNTTPAASYARRLLFGSLNEDYAVHTLRESNPWWAINYESPVLVTELKIFNRLSYGSRFWRFCIEARDKAGDWTIRRIVLDGASPEPATDGIILWKPLVPIIAYGIRLRLLERGIINLRRLELVGSALS